MSPRNRPYLHARAVAALLALCALAVPLAHAADPGAIVGIVRNAAGTPVAGATVTAVHTSDHAIRATVSAPDGTYTFGDLPTGPWQVSWEASGYAEADTALEVVPGKAARHDVVMNVAGAAGAAPALVAASAAPGSTPAPSAAPTVPEALQAPDPAPADDTLTPLAVGYIGWMNGTSRETAPIFDTKFFTPGDSLRCELPARLQSSEGPHHRRLDRGIPLRANSRSSRSASAATSTGTTSGRACCPCSACLPRPRRATTRSPAVGQWDLQGAYKYISEANAGYHFDVDHGLNVDVGHLRLLHRPVQLLQLRQLDVPALVRVIQHAVVLQWPARAVVADAESEDRAVADQRLAVLREIQPHPGLRRPDPVDPERLAQAGVQHLHAGRGQSGQSAVAYPHNGGNRMRNQLGSGPTNLVARHAYVNWPRCSAFTRTTAFS